MFGSVSEWFYRAIGGINPAPDAVGFSKVIIRPQPVGDLTWAKASYDSVRGKIVSEWKSKTNEFRLHLRIPRGVTATVYLPAPKGTSVFEGGKRLGAAKGVVSHGVRDGRAILLIGSGDYDFKSE